MSKVQPNHNRRIMQTGLGQPPNHSVQQTQDEALEVEGEVGGRRMGKKDANTSNIVRTASFHMCRYMYCRYIYKYYCGEKRGVPRFEEVTAEKKKRERENLLDGSKREFC